MDEAQLGKQLLFPNLETKLPAKTYRGKEINVAMKQSNEVKPDMHCSHGWYPALVLSGGENIPPPGNWAAHRIQVAGLISGRGARLPRQNDSEQPGFILASIKASGCSISIFRTQHLKGQVPSEVFIFLSGVCALIEVPALCCCPTSTTNRLYPPQLSFYLNCQQSVQLRAFGVLVCV